MSKGRSPSRSRPGVGLRADTTPFFVPHTPSPPSPTARLEKRGDRTSFVSIKEDDAGVAQTFVDSKPKPSAAQDPEEDHHDHDHHHNDGGILVDDDDDDAAAAIYTDPDATMLSTLTVQQPPAGGCPCSQFRGWKQIRLRGRWMSRSVGDLRLLGGDHQQDVTGEEEEVEDLETAPTRPAKEAVPHTYSSGLSPLERLPTEVLDQIIGLLATDAPPNGCTHRNTDLISCLLTSRTLHLVTLTTLYRNVTLPHSLIFSKFLRQMAERPALGTAVRRLDFSHFSSVGLGRTKRMNAELQMVTAGTLTECLGLTPRLREFLAQEHLEDDLDARVLGKLFCDLPLVRAMDFCACSSALFRDAFATVVSRTNTALAATLALERLSLHECATLPPAAFDALLPRLAHLTHLDVGHTQITNAALESIPPTARLTHLNLSRCTRLAGDRTVAFLTRHPAAQGSLVYLNLLADTSRYRLLSSDDVAALLPHLPSSLRALNLSGAKILSEHVPLLRPLVSSLEELSLGYSELSLADLQSFWLPPDAARPEDGARAEAKAPWSRPSLRYLDLTGISAIGPSVLFSGACFLLQVRTQPLEVLELGERVISGLHSRTASSKQAGWVVRELGRRGWYVREPSGDAPATEKDGGRRAWKMGAMWWGMKKVPVAWSEVGGLYGHYMFKK